jgi:ribose transport system ATP-binding protein
VSGELNSQNFEGSTAQRATAAVVDPNSVQLERVSKTFLGTQALKAVSVTFRFGEIHAVVGENGAGKSTLFKILSGFHAPDSGSKLFVRGDEQSLPLSPTSAARLGFAFVHQDLALAESMNVMENVALGGMMRNRLGIIRWRAQARAVERLLADLSVNISARKIVGELSQAEKAVVAIARALYARGRYESTLLVLDEPTANLTNVERNRLFETMRRAAKQGTAVVFCTHRLEEVLDVTSAVSVLRDGQLVASRSTEDVRDKSDLVRDILGRELDTFFPSRPDESRSDVVLAVRDLSGDGVQQLTLSLHAGEVVGLTGLAGSGHDAVPGLIFGSRRRTGGTIEVNGKAVRSISPRSAVRSGIGMLPSDRKRDSGLMSASIRENLTLVSLDQFVHGGLLRQRAERTHVLSALSRFDVRPSGDPDRQLGSLSGGNQQKVLLAKWLTRPALKSLILHEPTQGVDVGAKRAILELITEIAGRGVGIILVSSEHEELSHLCNRVAIMRSGRIRAELDRPSAERIAEQCYVA